MREDYFWCVVIFLWKSLVAPAFGKTCIPSNHNVIIEQQTFKILNRKNFEPNTTEASNFLPFAMILDKQSNRLIIGARDYIFYADDTTLRSIREQSWISNKQKIATCLRLKSMPKDYCANYIHFLAINDSKLFVCGTNSLAPKYKIVSLSRNFTVLKEKLAYGVCALRPDHAMVGGITNLGELISGSYRDYNSKNPIISGTFVFKDGQQKQKKKEKGDGNEFMNQPEFISSVTTGDSVYIFLMERAIEEEENRRTSTVVRLCKGDNGGSRLMSNTMWTTFRKSRLVCIVDNGNEKYYFQNLIDVVYDEKQDVFYATYTMFKNLNMHSAVCTFSRVDIDKTFSGKFLETRKGPNYLQPIDNGNFLNGCKVNSANLSNSNPSVSIDGKQPTNYLNIKALTKAMYYSLMEDKVKHQPNIFEFMLTGKTFTRLVILPLNRNGKSVPVLCIGTETGSILMVYKNMNLKPCIIKEIESGIGKVQRLLIYPEKRRLYASSYTKVISLQIDYCHMYQGEDECLQAHDPLCGWNLSKKQCVYSTDGTSYQQDLSICSSRTNYFGPWSEWSPCQDSSKKYCFCRSRSCSSCNISLCDNGHMAEIKDCTVNSVSNADDWLSEGSIDGSWSNWLAWSSCHSEKCGNYTMSRFRTCTSPEPKNGGRKCDGDSFECKSCLTNPTLIDTIWSGWSSWGACEKVNNAYIMSCTRTCSKRNACPGSFIKRLPCTPEAKGISWANWSACSCAQRVRHRLPKLINGCTNCSCLTYPQYEICDCPTTTKKIPTTKEITTAVPITKTCMPVTSQKESPTPRVTDNTKVKVKTEKADSINQSVTPPVTIIHVSSAPHVNPGCDPEKLYTLKNLVIIVTIVIVTCFLIFALVICLILRRKQNEKVLLNGKTNSPEHTPLRNFNPVET